MNKAELKSRPRVQHPQRHGVRIADQSLVRTFPLQSGRKLPLVVQAGIETPDLFRWAANNREFINGNLADCGALLFRGFHIQTQADFERFLPAVSTDLVNYMEGSSPRTQLGEKVYSSTEYPALQTIMMHNELAYVKSPPLRIWFCCLKASEQGGETPIADVRRVFQRIAPSVREKFRAKQWSLVRNFGNGMSLPWQTSFITNEKTEVERYCRASDVEYEWLDEHHLRTRCIRPAVIQHPTTGEWVWFNHIAFWHLSSLAPAVRQSMLAVFDEKDVPYNTYYGDGSPIEDHVVQAITEAYDYEKITFPWREGDVLMLDNMLTAHGRNPFVGTRKVLVAMADPLTNKDH